mmetsp:Transcript_25074/g.55613  ORF Transcript_25074/g.55613 Transcript_25074/m.55613 type:complete len:607 (-) Transcript_25074:909-2729(-)
MMDAAALDGVLAKRDDDTLLNTRKSNHDDLSETTAMTPSRSDASTRSTPEEPAVQPALQVSPERTPQILTPRRYSDDVHDDSTESELQLSKRKLRQAVIEKERMRKEFELERRALTEKLHSWWQTTSGEANIKYDCVVADKRSVEIELEETKKALEAAERLKAVSEDAVLSAELSHATEIASYQATIDRLEAETTAISTELSDAEGGEGAWKHRIRKRKVRSRLFVLCSLSLYAMINLYAPVLYEAEVVRFVNRTVIANITAPSTADLHTQQVETCHEIDNASTDSERYEETIADLERRLEAANAKIGRANVDGKENQAALVDMKRKLDEVNGIINDASKDADKCKATITDLERRFEGTNSQVGAAKKDIKEHKLLIADLKVKLDAANEEIDNANQKAVSYEAAIADYEKQLMDARAQIGTAIEGAKKCEAASAQCERKLEEAVELTSNTSLEVEKYRETIANYEKRLKDASTKIGHSLEESERYEATIMEYKEKLKGVNTQMFRSSRKKQWYKSAIVDYAKQLEDSNSQTNVVSEEAKKYKSIVTGIESRLNASAERYTSTITKIEKAISELDNELSVERAEEDPFDRKRASFSQWWWWWFIPLL